MAAQDQQEHSSEESQDSEGCRCTYYAKLFLIVVASWIVYSYVLKNILKRIHAFILANVLSKLLASYNRAMAKRKERLFSALHKIPKDGKPLKVLEIGAGPGANFAHFPKGAQVICVEPNDFFESFLKSNLEKSGSHVTLAGFEVCKAEDMSRIPAGSVDAVVCTLVLCSVDDVDRSLKEIHRVLKPGGKFLFMEHVAAESGTWTFMFQRLIKYPWLWILECNFRHNYHNIRSAGFSNVDLELFTATELLEGESFLSQKFHALVVNHMVGIATK